MNSQMSGYTYMDKLAKAGISVPVVPGIMPVTNAKQIKRIVNISGNALPDKFMRIINRYGENPAAASPAENVRACSSAIPTSKQRFGICSIIMFIEQPEGIAGVIPTTRVSIFAKSSSV